jgi:hypothetical protein
MCNRTSVHNYKLCPWAHPGETAALRRHPSCHVAELCPAVRQVGGLVVVVVRGTDDLLLLWPAAALRSHGPPATHARLRPRLLQHQECPHGEGCVYSRNAFEAWLHPDR